MSNNLYKVTKKFGQQLATVEAEFVKVPGCKRCELLCDYLQPDGKRVLYVRHRKKPFIFISIDEGESWEKVDLSSYFSVPLVRLHVVDKELYLVQLVDGENVILSLIDKNFAPIKSKSYKGYKWHGSLGVGSANGVTLLSEYRGTSSDETVEELLNIYRISHDQGAEAMLDRMSAVLTKPALVKDTGDNIRHFHTVFPDPYSTGTWYASSGDNGKQNRVWVSHDDGLNWNQIKFEYELTEASESFRDRLLRFTSVVVLEDKIIWATDDDLGIKKSALVVFDKVTKVIEVPLYFDQNLMRNLVRLDDKTVLGLSESKNDLTCASAYIVDVDEKASIRFDFPNLLEKSCPVTLSLAASQLHEGRLYISSLGRIFTHRINGLVRLKINLEDL